MERKKWSSIEKADIAIRALIGVHTIKEISIETGAHPNMITKWKKNLMENASILFKRRDLSNTQISKDMCEMYKLIGKLYVENSLLKTK